VWWVDHGGGIHLATDEKELIPGPRDDRRLKRRPINSTIRVRPSEPDVLLHEIAHRVEAIHGPVRANGYRPLNMATLLFHEERTKDETAVMLRDLYPHSGYEADEVSKPDEFFDAYVGKVYSPRTIRERSGAATGELVGSYVPTEVLTMGLQYLFFPTFSRNLDRDVGHRRLILGALAAV
jgi:hypothetical protein